MDTFEETFCFDNADKLASYIVEIFGETTKTPFQRQLDYDCSLIEGNMKTEIINGEPKVNTWFKFDSLNNTLAKRIVNVLIDEEIEPTEERIALFSKFRSMVSLMLENKYKEALGDKIRKYVLGGASKEVFPLNQIEVKYLDISDNPTIDYTITLEKMSNPDKLESGIAQEIARECLISGDSIEKVFKRLSKKYPSRYSTVKKIIMTKAFYEFNLDLYVDYSVSEDFIKAKPDYIK
jgi:hypothetical protein